MEELMSVDTFDQQTFELANGRKFSFVRFIPPNNLLVWEDMVCKGLDVHDVDVETLKAINVWDNLPVEVQNTIAVRKVDEVKEVHELMAKARASRKKKYENMPKEMTCIQCGNVVEIIPSQIAAKINKKNILLVDFIASFKCKRCNPPVRGKKPNPEFVNLPKELVCKCGNSINISPYSLVKRAKDKKVTIEEFVAGWTCQKCNPTKGRKSIKNI